jgi:hypothetical protein
LIDFYKKFFTILAMKSIKSTVSLLPEGIVAEDSVWPSGSKKDRVDGTLGNCGTLDFHFTSFGWVISTLPISKSRSGFADRTYGVKISDGSSVRIGNGPHVIKSITVYIRNSRLKALQKYIDLYNKGMSRANEIRDRISSRRVEGVERRAAGERSWYWSS